MVKSKLSIMLQFMTCIVSSALTAQTEHVMPLGRSEKDVYSILVNKKEIKSYRHVYISLATDSKLTACIFEFDGENMSVRTFNVGRDQKTGWRQPDKLSNPIALPNNYKSWVYKLVKNTDSKDIFDSNYVYSGSDGIYVKIKSPKGGIEYNADPLQDGNYFELVALIQHSTRWGRSEIIQ